MKIIYGMMAVVLASCALPLAANCPCCHNVMEDKPSDPASNDPKLGRWEVALVLDDGTIVEFYAAEFDWEWNQWKGGVMAQRLFLYNRDNDPDAHLVWGGD